MCSNITIREIQGQTELNSCTTLQKEVLGLNNEQLISPLILNVYTRSYPRTGLLLGAFINDLLVGFILSIAGVKNNSLYGVIIVVKKEYQNLGVGLKLFIKTKNIAIEKGIQIFYGIFDPLEGNLAHLYFTNLGMIGIKYEPSVYQLKTNDIPIDKILLRWDLNKKNVKKTKIYNHDELLNEYAICNATNYSSENQLLVPIPENFTKLKLSDPKRANDERMRTREIFNYYVNKKKYILDSFHSFKNDKGRNNYYLLAKSD